MISFLSVIDVEVRSLHRMIEMLDKRIFPRILRMSGEGMHTGQKESQIKIFVSINLIPSDYLHGLSAIEFKLAPIYANVVSQNQK